MSRLIDRNVEMANDTVVLGQGEQVHIRTLTEGAHAPLGSRRSPRAWE